MKAINTKNTRKQLIGLLTMLLFLFASNAFSQQTAGNPGTLTTSNFTMLVSQLEADIISAYPVPFTGGTLISYSIPREEDVKLTVFDQFGREVQTILEDTQSAGSYTVDLRAANLSSGIYYYRLTIGSYTDVKKITYIR